ncbi:hypothetical protein [Dactylosporangium sp. NPDC051541]|uniref:hypothetical protein n=1 Tax=Dactylosporangium sp. NPDC051541 TaxID=3363977 RepID=UPI00379FD938
MADDLDRMLGAAFAELTAARAPHVKPAGLAPVRARVHRRRTVRTALAAAAAVLVVVIPVAAFATRDRGDATPPIPAVSASAPSSPAGTDAPTIDAVNADCSRPPVEGPVSVQDLCDGTVPMPATDHSGLCPEGPTLFSAGQSGGPVLLLRTVRADVDHDGRPETAALYHCGGADPGRSTVAAVLTRTAEGVRALGGLRAAADIGADESGRIWARFDSDRPADPLSIVDAVHQWRGFGWDGSAFVQDRGSVSFDVRAAGLTVTAALRLDRPGPDGVRPATLTIAVGNLDRDAHAGVDLRIPALTGGPVAERGDCILADESHTTYNRCLVGTVAAAETRTVVLHYLVNPADVPRLTDPAGVAGTVFVHLGDRRAGQVAIPPATT